MAGEQLVIYDLEDPKVRDERRRLLSLQDRDADDLEAQYVRQTLGWDSDRDPDRRLP